MVEKIAVVIMKIVKTMAKNIDHFCSDQKVHILRKEIKMSFFHFDRNYFILRKFSLQMNFSLVVIQYFNLKWRNALENA